MRHYGDITKLSGARLPIVDVITGGSPLYAQQTADEQRAGETKLHNNAGFNGADSRFLSSVSEFLIRRGYLTDKQKAVVRRKLVKYTKQLTRLANA